MMEGWTKNLARLFGYPLMMAAWRGLDLLLLIALPLLLWHFFALPIPRYALAVVWLRVLWRYYSRVAKSNFSPADCALSVFALPLFCLLLVMSDSAQPSGMEGPILLHAKGHEFKTS